MAQRLVEKTIEALQKRLADSHNSLCIQGEGGFTYNATCTFYPPATDEQIAYVEKQTGYKLPDDYKTFLKITNGCRLFDDVHYGGEAYLYSLQQLVEYNSFYDPFEGCFSVAYIYQEQIVINSEREPYLFWKGHIDHFQEARPLQLTFEQWLARFIVCHGTKFWRW